MGLPKEINSQEIDMLLEYKKFYNKKNQLIVVDVRTDFLLFT